MGSLAVQLANDMAANPIRYYRPNETAIKFHADDHWVKMASGGNGSGKSVLMSAEIAQGVSGVDSIWLKRLGISVAERWKWFKPPLRVRIWCPDLTKNARPHLVPMMQGMLPPHLLDTSRGTRGFNIESSTLHLRNGATIQYMSYMHDIDVAESVELHCVGFDEPPPEAYFDRQLGRVARIGGILLGAMTTYARLVKHPIAWFDRRIRRKGLNKEMGADVVAHYAVSSFENLHNLPPEGQKQFLQWAKMLKTRDPAAYDACVLGLPGLLQGLVYKEFQEHIHARYDKASVADFIEMAKRGEGEIWGSVDHGLRDPTVFLWFFVCRKPTLSRELAEGDVILFSEYYVPNAKPTSHIPNIAKRTQGWPIRGYFCPQDMWNQEVEGLTVAARYIQGLGKLGVCNRMARAKSFHNKDIGHELVEWLMTVPGPNHYPSWPRFRILNRAAPHTVDEVLGYSWTAEDDRTGKGGDKTVEVNDHCPDALRYFAASMRWERPPTQSGRVPRDPATNVPLDLLTHPGLFPRRVAI